MAKPSAGTSGCSLSVYAAPAEALTLTLLHAPCTPHTDDWVFLHNIPRQSMLMCNQRLHGLAFAQELRPGYVSKTLLVTRSLSFAQFLLLRSVQRTPQVEYTRRHMTHKCNARSHSRVVMLRLTCNGGSLPLLEKSG